MRHLFGVDAATILATWSEDQWDIHKHTAELLLNRGGPVG